jgi:hypothetical protein
VHQRSKFELYQFSSRFRLINHAYDCIGSTTSKAKIGQSCGGPGVALHGHTLLGLAHGFSPVAVIRSVVENSACAFIVQNCQLLSLSPSMNPLVQSQSERSFSRAKGSPPQIPVSCMKSRRRTSKPVKRVRFRDGLAYHDRSMRSERIPVDRPEQLPAINADGLITSRLPSLLEDLSLFDLDEMIPEATEPGLSPPPSPFHRRSVKKYELLDGEDMDGLSETSLFNSTDAVSQRAPTLARSPSSDPIPIKRPQDPNVRRQHFGAGHSVDDETEDEDVSKFIQKLSYGRTHGRYQHGSIL